MTLWHLEVCTGVAPKPAEVNENEILKKIKRGEFMYFHSSLNSLLYLLEHKPFLCNRDYISSSVLCHHTLCGSFILFSVLSMQVPSAGHSGLQGAGTAHLGH